MRSSIRSLIWFLLIWLALIAAGLGSAAAADAVAEATPYKLTDTLKTGVKSILNERTAQGTRVGAIVRIYNGGTAVAVIPEYEVRVKSAEGITYALEPSAANAKAVQPRETVELSYMIVVKRQDDFSLSQLSWVNVDEFVYPKQETTAVSIPIDALEWKGLSAGSFEEERIIDWGKAFTLPGGSESIEFTPVQLAKQSTPDGLVTVVRIRAENTGETLEWISDFTLAGTIDQRRVTGSRAEAEALSLAPGEQRYIHFTLPTGQERISSLTVITPESFATAEGTEIPYGIGQLQVQVPATVSSPTLRRQTYQLGRAISFDAASGLSGSDIDISLVEIQRFEQAGDGYQTAIAKFRMTNRGSRTVPLPVFGVEYETSKGDRYTGARQNITWQSLLPNIGFMVSYAFTIPASEEGEKAVIHVLDGQDGAGLEQEIASLSTSLSPAPAGDEVRLYPFTVTVDDWAVKPQFNSGSSGFYYTYSLDLDVTVLREADTMVDGKSTRLMAELAYPSGRVLDAAIIPLTGNGRLMDGEQSIPFEVAQTDQIVKDLIVTLYEVFDTPEGEVARFLTVLE